MARLDKLDPQRRRQLLAAAAREFAERGFEAASLARISAEAGISKAAVYYYFEDKVDLYAKVVEAAFAAIEPATPLDLESLTAEDFWPRLQDAYVEMLAQAQQEAWLVAAGRLVYAPPPPGADATLAEQFERARATLERIVRRGQALGLVRADLPIEFLAAVVSGTAEAADRWMTAHWEELSPEQAGELALQVFELLRGLATGEAER